jgi:hypothetical protein
MYAIVRGTPFLSLLFMISFVLGPMTVMTRSEFCTHPESVFNSPLAVVSIPATLPVLGIIIVVLFSIRHVELIIGTKITLIIGVISWVSDLLTRRLFWTLFDMTIKASGPYSIVMTFFSLYCVFMPTVNARLIAVNEKCLLFVLILSIGFFDQILSFIPLSVGFVVFLLSCPFCLPPP